MHLHLSPPMHDLARANSEMTDPLTVLGLRVRNLIENMQTPTAFLDKDLRFVAVSRSWRKSHGLEKMPLIGRCHLDIVSWLPEDFKRAHERGLSGQASHSHASLAVLPDGRAKWLRWAVTPIRDVDRTVVGIVLESTDITSEKLAEEKLTASERKLRLAGEVAGIGDFSKSYARNEIILSPQVQKLLDSEGLPEDLQAWLQRDTLDVEEIAFLETHGAFNPVRDGELLVDFHPRIEGEFRHLRISARILFEDPDYPARPTEVLGLLLDETESNRLTEALGKSQRLEAVGRMAGMIAHDFNNLLTVILSNLEMARNGPLDDRTRNHIDRAISVTSLGTSFNRRLLALGSSRNAHPQRLLLDEHLARFWAMIERVLSDEMHARFLPDAAGYWVRIDPGELDGAILNLVTNAREAAKGPCELTFSTHFVEPDHPALAMLRKGDVPDGPPGFVCIRIKDTGPGMPTKVLNQATEPFFTTKLRDRGTGLGLTSVAAAMERAGGGLEILSRPGQGTTVSLFLPLVHAPAETDTAPEQDKMPMGDGELVLVVEDDPMVRETVLDRLEALGYAVLEAGSEDQALEMIDSGEPVQLVFSDVVLGADASGYDLASRLGQDRPEIPVLLTTGHTSLRLAPMMKGNHDIPMLRKPYSLAQLADAVARTMGGHRGQSSTSTART